MAYETKCQILNVNEKSGWCKLKTMLKKNLTWKQRIRNETPKTYIDSKEIHAFRFFI